MLRRQARLSSHIKWTCCFVGGPFHGFCVRATTSSTTMSTTDAVDGAAAACVSFGSTSISLLPVSLKPVTNVRETMHVEDGTCRRYPSAGGQDLPLEKACDSLRTEVRRTTHYDATVGLTHSA